MKQNRLRLFSSHRRCPMKWVVAAVAALLGTAHVGAQVVYSRNFDGANDKPTATSQTSKKYSFRLSAGTVTGNSLYDDGWRSYYGHSTANSTDENKTAPRLVTGSSANIFRHSGTASIGFGCRAGHSSNPNPGIVLLPELSEPVNKLVIKFWFGTNTDIGSELSLSVGYVEGTDYTDGTTGTSVNADFHSLQEIPASTASYVSSNGLQPDKGTFVEVELKNAPSTATRIAIRCNVPGGALRYCCIDDVEVSIAETCKKVSNLAASSITTTSATLTWTEEGESTQWQVRLNGGAAQTVTSTTYALTGLTANTAYTAEVRADCGGGEYSDWTPVTFRTLCNPVSSLPFTETFESYTTGVGEEIDLCWHTATVGNATKYVYPNTRGANGSSKSLFMQAGTSYYSLAVLPQLSVPLSQLMIEFDLKRDATFSNLSNVQVGIITDPSDISTFTPLRSINLTGAAANAESHYRLSLADYTGTGRLAFYVPTASSTSCIDIDNVTVDYLPACPWIEDFAIQSLTEGTLTVTWSGSASLYEAQFATASDFTAGLTTNTVSVTRATFSGLETGQYYYVRVRAKCGSDYGEWSDALEAYATDFSAAGVTGLYPATGTVVLNDLEPHDWSLYTNDVDAPMRSLNPLDVKITYRGYGTNNMSSNVTYNTNSQSTEGYVPVKPSDFTASTTEDDVSVGITAEERQYHTFEYYKTLERVDKLEGTGRAEYQTIFNPFSRRPTYGSPADYTWDVLSSLNGAPCWRGFYKWRIDRLVGGDVYTEATGGTALAVGDMVMADQKLYFEGSTGMEIEFTAMWAPAIVRYYSGIDQSNVPARAHGAYAIRDTVGVERNFLVCNGEMFIRSNYSIRPYLPLDHDATNLGIFACTYTSVFPNGTIDGVEPAYGPVKEAVTTSLVARSATYINLCKDLTKAENSVKGFNSDTRFEYLAFSRLRGERNGFHLDGSHAALWGTIGGSGRANLTLGRGIEPMFDDNKGTFNYIWGVGPVSTGQTNWGARRNEDNYACNDGGDVIWYGTSYPKPSAYQISYNTDFTIRLESGYVGCLMTLSGWNSAYQDIVGKDLQSQDGSNSTPSNRLNGSSNYSRFIMGTDFDRADELQRVRELGTDYASKNGPNGQPYESLDSMLYHEVYKNAKVKIYRPFRVSSFQTQMNNQDRNAVYSDIIIKSGFVGQESIDRQKWGHGDGATGSKTDNKGKVIVDGIERGGWMVHSIYNVASNNNAHVGKRRMRIEGGFINSSVSLGAWDRTNDVTRWYSTYTGYGNATHRWATASERQSSMPNDVSTLRMTGGHITGSVFGGGNTYTASGGGRQIIITGGTVRAWIAGGVNGSDARADQWEGIHFGNTWIYAGGTLHVGSGDTTHRTVGDTVYHLSFCGINGTTDGQIFGAGCGMKPFYYRADSVEIDHLWNTYAWKHHRGGRVDSSFVYIADQAEVEGDVYGGGNYGYNNTEDGDDYSERWTGANDSKGDPTYPAKGKATLRILGGTVGGNVFGGANRKMGREVDILMTGGHVKRGIYGGSNTWGYIKKDVTINLLGGTVGTDERPGIVCGGGLGKETAVFGNITLNIGAPGTPGPVIKGDVYGGSQQGTTNAGTTSKTFLGIFNKDPNHGTAGQFYDIYSVSIDTADAQGQGYNPANKTIVTMTSGLIDGNLYGGGFGPNNTAASTYGDITVNFLGGEVMQNIYGCNNASGKPMGKVKVNIGTPDSVAASVADGDRSHRNRPVVHGSVYGGGNEAPYGTADHNYTPVVEMFSGTVGKNVFGGGQGGTAVVTLPDETHATKVLIRNGSVQGNVYGGGNDAKVIGNTRVVIGHDGTLFTLTVASSNPSQGTATGGGTYSQDEDVVLTATPASGYSFKQWSDGNTSNPRTVTVSANQTYTAEFETTPQYNIDVTANEPSWGTFSGAGSYDAGSRVQIKATPNTGVRFTQWSDGVTYNPRTVTVTADATYTAQFESVPQWTLTVQPNNASYGSVSGGGTLYEGVITSISASANDGYLFRRWSDGETYNPRTLSLTSNLTLTAIFEPIPTWTLTLLVSPAGAGTVDGAGSYLETETASFSTAPNTGYRFLRWSDGETDLSRSMRLTENTTLTAIYEAIPTYTITANVATGQGTYGTVTGGGTYYENTTATLRAQPNTGYRFTQWSDGVTTNPRTVTVTANATYTAEFEEFHVYWVDLGLPSGTLWAEVNVGAINPSDYGDYFAWGETAPKTTYNWSTYAYSNGTQYTLTKYNSSSSYGTVDNKTTLEAADDAATAILGNGAYTPTATQWSELINNTTATMTTQNGVRGMLVTGPNGNSIFLPAAGYKSGTGTNAITSYGYYWTASLNSSTNSSYAQYAYHNLSSNSRTVTTMLRNNGAPVRAVRSGCSGLSQYTITANVAAGQSAMGSVSGGGTHCQYTRTTLRATPNSGYRFTQWSDGNTDNPRTVNVTGNAAYTAEFVSMPLVYSTGFESGQDVAWEFNNDATNKWYIGSGAYRSGSKGLYISNDNGTSNTYNNSTTTNSFAYRTLNFEAGNYIVEFNWMCTGETCCDYIVVYLCPDSQVPSSAYTTGSSTIPTGWQRLTSERLNGYSSWQTFTQTFNISTTGAYKLVFFWRNDHSVGVLPAAIDNVNIYKY